MIGIICLLFSYVFCNDILNSLNRKRALTEFNSNPFIENLYHLENQQQPKVIQQNTLQEVLEFVQQPENLSTFFLIINFEENNLVKEKQQQTINNELIFKQSFKFSIADIQDILNIFSVINKVYSVFTMGIGVFDNNLTTSQKILQGISLISNIKKSINLLLNNRRILVDQLNIILNSFDQLKDRQEIMLEFYNQSQNYNLIQAKMLDQNLQGDPIKFRTINVILTQVDQLSFIFRDEVKQLMNIILDLKNKSEQIVQGTQKIIQDEETMDILDKVDAYLTLINNITTTISQIKIQVSQIQTQLKSFAENQQKVNFYMSQLLGIINNIQNQVAKFAQRIHTVFALLFIFLVL